MIRPRYILRTLLLTASLLGMTSCGFVGFPGVYKIDIEQGNLVTQEMIEQLQPGMSRRQVRFIMGSPLVEDTFQPDRWDYPYVIRNGPDIIREAQVRIFFEGDKLVNVTGDYLPDWANPNAESAEGIERAEGIESAQDIENSDSAEADESNSEGDADREPTEENQSSD